jgi:hypothetical protein
MTEQLPTAGDPSQPAPRLKPEVSLVACYFLAVLAPILLKLAHLTRVATWPWLKVLAPLWGPWLLLVVLSLCGLLVRWGQRWYERA